jgi:hypothetical protein
MDLLKTIVQLRISVAALGEKNGAAWWDCSFLEEASIRYLSYAFPRAPELAALEGAFEAARRVHDTRIGVQGVNHLFRLPYEIELRLVDTMKMEIPDLCSYMKNANADPSKYMSSLSGIASVAEPGYEGPLKIGSSAEEMLTEATLKRMAAIYLGAFNSRKKSFPYIQSQK